MPEAAIIGKVLGPGTGRVFLRSLGQREIPRTTGDCPGFLPKKMGLAGDRPNYGHPAKPGRTTMGLSGDCPNFRPTTMGLSGDCPNFRPTTMGLSPLSLGRRTPWTAANTIRPREKRLACARGEAAGDVAGIEGKFREFLEAANAPGTLDARTKRRIAIALSVLARCEPCLKSHLKKAREMGLSQEEIDEAAWLGVSFGGSPAMTFYNRTRKG